LKRSMRVLPALALLGLTLGLSSADPLEADRLLDDVVARLPAEPLRISGDLLVRKRHGVPVNRFSFEMLLDWGQLPNTARYTIRDAFGTDLEQLTVKRDADGTPNFHHASGDPLKADTVPPLFDTVQSSDISWVDLALAFLWWKGGEVTGSEEVKGRKCHVVEVPAPGGADDAVQSGEKTDGAGTPYARVRLWIDEELRMLLQAEGLDAEDNLIRKLWVKSFKKIDDHWMIKDLEVQSYPVKHRTKLSIREMVADTPL